MNPYLLLGAVAAFTLSLLGAFTYGKDLGRDQERAEHLETAQLIREARDVAMQGAAAAIANIKISNTTIRQRVETEVREKEIYRECQHTPETLLQINSALGG